MKPRDYCCCAIPTVNAGIYATLTEQFVIGVVVGVLSIATPRIVGAATPGFAPWILAIICWVVSGIQVLGFIGVSKEKPTLYRRYVTLHGLIITAAFGVAAAWIILSALKHNDAKQRCINDFFGGDGNASEGESLCNIFPWADIGIMGGLWVILGIFHFYLFIVVSSYGKGQRQDHDDYYGLSDPTQPLTKDTIPLEDRNDPWDSRDDQFTAYPRNYKHVRNNSSMSASDVLTEPQQRPMSSAYNYDNYDTSYQSYQPYTDNTPQAGYPVYGQQANAISYRN